MNSIEDVFGNKIRVRACGLCYKDEAILLAKHNIDGKTLWSPPGGGIEFGESIEDTLIREFREETCLKIEPGEFLFLHEFISTPLHAIEFFYKVNSYEGELAIGSDPELKEHNIIVDVGFFNQQHISQLPESQLHHVLKICNNPIDLLHIQGQIK